MYVYLNNTAANRAVVERFVVALYKTLYTFGRFAVNTIVATQQSLKNIIYGGMGVISATTSNNFAAFIFVQFLFFFSQQ